VDREDGTETAAKKGIARDVRSEATTFEPDSRDARPGSVIRLTIPAKAEYVTLCRLTLAGIARVRPLSGEELADLKLAITEAASNSVRHAYPGNGDGQVDVSFDVRPDRIVIEVVDDGFGFDPNVDSGAGAGELSEGGLGIAIIRALADEVDVESRAGERGSRLRFVKLLGQSPPSA
jgi:serine/threonine-protein kinase RsbW